MAEVSAAQVKALREATGLPMMDCKKALAEANGDQGAAVTLLRKRGAVAAEKKAGRETAEGRIGCFVDAANAVGGLVELNCETAPVANNAEFVQLADAVAREAALGPQPPAPESLPQQKLVDDPSRTVKDLIHDTLNRLRENMVINCVAVLKGRLGSYIHFNGKVGVLLAVEGGGGDDALLTDLCMHIAWAKPIALTRDDAPAETVENEREIARAQATESGKPPEIAEKIVTGKLNRWFSEHVLLEQVFVKDEKGKATIEQVLKSAGDLRIAGFERLEVGG